jgi:rod shape-determining protein MreC
VILTGLVFLSVSTLVSRNDTMVVGLRSISLQVAGNMERRLSWIGDYISALEENSQLRSQNVQLSSQVARSREAVLENLQLRELLALEDSLDYPTLATKIISKDVNRQQNLITLDAGSRDGVAVGMAVIDEDGILGRIVLVSEDYSRAMSILHTDFRVPARVEPGRAEGIVKWDGTDARYITLEHVLKTDPVEKGQLVVTSASSGSFQPGYPVGIVDSVARLPGRNEYSIRLSPSANYFAADYVFVVLQLPSNEQRNLESTPVQ